MKDEILSCGHGPSPHEEHTTGTAHTRDGRGICWHCADSEQAAELSTRDSVVLYVSGNGQNITTWSGGVLMQVTSEHKTRHNWGSIWHYRARDANGKTWYGKGPGRGMYIKLHKSKRAP